MKGELSLEKRCIWNWDHGKKIEYLEEKGKKAKFETIFGIGIASVAGIFFGVLPLVVIFYYIFEIVLQGPSVIPVSYTHLDVYKRQCDSSIRKKEGY